MPESREEHLQWCKERALAYLAQGDTQNAVNSFMSDMKKHAETENHPALLLGVMLLGAGHLDNVEEVRHFIQGFN